MAEQKEKKANEKKPRIFNVKDAKELKIYSEALVSQKVYAVINAFIAKDGLLCYRFTTAPITEAKKKAILTVINKARESQ